MQTATPSIIDKLRITNHGFRRLCESGRICEALLAVLHLDRQGRTVPTGFLYHLIVGCINRKDLGTGQEVHRLIRDKGLHDDSFLANHLIRMYDSCGCLSDANDVLSDLSETDVFVWTSLISAQAKHGNIEQVFRCFHEMHRSNIHPDGHAFVAAIKACASQASTRDGQLFHAHLTESGNELNVFVESALIDMYTKGASLEDACALFDAMTYKNVVSWSMMIMAHVQYGSFWEALSFYRQMQIEGTMPDLVTFISILKACASVGMLEHGKATHLQILESTFVSDASLVNTLLDMYIKCGNLMHSRKVFEGMCAKDTVTWSIMIAGYVQHGNGTEALHIFHRMHQLNIVVDRVTLLSCLKACSNGTVGSYGKLIHALLIEIECESDASIGNALIDVYANSGSLEDACSVFRRLSKQDVVTWTTMISGYSKFEQEPTALFLFTDMRQHVLLLDNVVFISTLKICTNLRSLLDGKLLHADIIENGFETHASLSNCLIDMYSSCWSLQDACKVFSGMQKWDTVAWNAMIAGCFRCNNYELAWKNYEKMQCENLKPDAVTFMSLLSACSRRGQLSQGYDLLRSMEECHGVKPTAEHCNCIADLLGRMGCVDEAENLLRSVESDTNIIGWTSLLSHCRMHSNMEIGERSFHRVVKLDPKNSKGYILMSSIFANTGRSNDAERIEQLRRCANAWNKRGNAFIMIENQLHSFLVGDDPNHYVVEKLENLSIRMEREGYLPFLDLSRSLDDEDDMDCCFNKYCVETPHPFVPP